MARSPAHRFGQIIGDLVEDAIKPLLRDVADRHGLYLDTKGPRPARGRRKKVSWTDRFGNTHDLDFVLERGGTEDTIGTPVALIETAWRRYTKHSRNKAQEIQGAILPLATTYNQSAPFIGVVVAGVFTHGALEQLQSVGFSVVYFPEETVIKAFQAVGIDASCTERTSDAEFRRKVSAWKKLSARKRAAVGRRLVEINSEEVQRFTETLEAAITRQVTLVRVLPLHGVSEEWPSVERAISFIQDYAEAVAVKPVVKYEIQVRFSNGDTIEGQFATKSGAVDFLKVYLPPNLRPAE